MDYWSIALAVCAVLLALYYFCRNDGDYFGKHGVKYPSPLPGVGNTWKILVRAQSFAEMLQDFYKLEDTAKYVGIFDMMTPVFVIRDLDLIKSIGVKHFDSFPEHRSFVDENNDPLFGKNLFLLRGDRWKEVRTLLSPAFTSSKMKSMFILMSECGADFANTLATLPKSEREVDMKDAFTRYTNDVIATCAFGINVNSMKDRNNLFYVYGKEATTFGTTASIKIFLIRSLPRLTRLFGIKIVREVIGKFFMELVADTMRTRKENGIVRPDMMQLMLENREKMNLTIEDMTAQAFIFFFAGFDTTSTLMCFAAHEIGANADVQEKLQQEIDNVLEENNGKLTYEALNNMSYLDAVINEALRMYPVAVAADRVCTKNFELPPAKPGLKPIVLEPGSVVWFPIYGIQRDPQYFDEPEKFKPERFIEDGKKIVNSGAYFPFGLGPRMCIGNRFALLETKTLLFHLLARCDLKPTSRTCIPMKLGRKGFAMTAENGFWMEIRPRSNPHPAFATKVSNGTAK